MPGEQRGPAVGNSSNKMEGRGEMTKASINLQDLRRRIYVEAGAGNVARGAGLRPTTKGVEKPPDPKVRAPALDPTRGGAAGKLAVLPRWQRIRVVTIGSLRKDASLQA